jgi:hypothetical protein
VGVHDVRTLGAEEGAQLLPDERIAPGGDGAPEVREDNEVNAVPAGAIEEVPFGADGRAGDERRAAAAEAVESLHRQERVLLRSAEDQAGDDVNAAKLLHGNRTNTILIHPRETETLKTAFLKVPLGGLKNTV